MAGQSVTIQFEPWLGEFGWEVMYWAPHCRLAALDYEDAVITSFVGMAPLYEDFAEFWAHDKTRRQNVHSNAMYYSQGIHYLYGNGDPQYDVLIHARGLAAKPRYNYAHWSFVAAGMQGLSAAQIGTADDQYVTALPDERGIGLQRLMDLMAGAKCVVGVSSGPMHLAAACGCPLVVWGDNKASHIGGETLERRYKQTWNPHGVHVEWITANDFQPQPREILKRIDKVLSLRKDK